MVQVQYIGEGHTSVYLDKSRVKTKVVNGEIIEVTPALAKSLQYRGFAIREDEVIPTPKKKK